jgi:hypothetical protein
MFAALTNHKDVAAVKACTTKDRDGSGKKTKRCWEQRWTWALPLEIIYLTPLENWNPCNLEFLDKRGNLFDKKQKELKRNGSKDHPYIGYSNRDNWEKVPSEFFKGQNGRDLADTGAGYYAEGNIKH